jgi:small nuclear ribonucleoprotein (snRNP)-like protein
VALPPHGTLEKRYRREECPKAPLRAKGGSCGKRDRGGGAGCQGMGSGVIIDQKGYVLTNNHVVEDADQIKVKLANGKEYDGKIVGRDPKTDLALLKIEGASDLHPLKLGNSDDLKVGNWVVAVESPFGLEQTVTAGIVSAKGRVIGSVDMSQTDSRTVTLYAGQVALGAVTNGNYIFSIPDNITAPVDNSGIATFNDVDIYEGIFVTNTFVVDDSQPNQKYILPNPYIDTSTIRVNVQDASNSTTINQYTAVDNIVGINSSSQIFLILPDLSPLSCK